MDNLHTYILRLCPNPWETFLVLLVVVLATSFALQVIGKFFFTSQGKRFSILDLQLVAYDDEIEELFEKMSSRDGKQSPSVSRAERLLRLHLVINFAFLVAIYPLIALMCYKASIGVNPVLSAVLIVLGVSQVLPMVIDIFENVSLLLISRRHSAMTGNAGWFGLYRWAVLIKWALALLAVSISIPMMLYHWGSGIYRPQSLEHLQVVIAMLTFYAVAATAIGFFLNRVVKPEKPAVLARTQVTTDA